MQSPSTLEQVSPPLNQTSSRSTLNSKEPSGATAGCDVACPMPAGHVISVSWHISVVKFAGTRDSSGHTKGSNIGSEPLQDTVEDFLFVSLFFKVRWT